MSAIAPLSGGKQEAANSSKMTLMTISEVRELPLLLSAVPADHGEGEVPGVADVDDR